MSLTDNEKRDAVRLIEAGKPLPDKYRFLLFEDKREVELVWNGKTSEVCNVVLPFQVIEQVDEPRAEKPEEAVRQMDMFATEARGRQLAGWSNKLIWGDNKLILSSLKNGPLREEIEAQGGIKLIYIDPPFDVGADFSMDIKIGDGTFTKKPSVLEELAYRDTWGKGADSFIAMIYERLVLMRDLLAARGPLIENHPRFPERANAGFMQIAARDHIHLRVYERGAGINLGLLEHRVTVSLSGGDAEVNWQGPNHPIYLKGLAHKVFSGGIES